jgi:hypothetical protein
MKVKISDMKNFVELYEKDKTERCIGYYKMNNISLNGRNTYYPNVLLYQIESQMLMSPYNEMVMSLGKKSFYGDDYEIDQTNSKSKNEIGEIGQIVEIGDPVFFFIYNFDNYYHFLYDTLPYLFTYLELKKTIPKLKILINYPNQTNTFYKFNLEFLTKIINVDDLIFDSNNVYKEMYVSTSLTHGGHSNNAPRKEIFQIYDILKNNIDYSNIDEKLKNLDQIYISRRSWINNDTTNIGTDYTSRRKMMNEDLLVDSLKEKGFIEIFAENLNTDEKIFLFSNAKTIIGAIGGGMANLLFSKSTTKTIVIESPYFLEINYRFKYSMDHTIIQYVRDVVTYSNSPIPLYCRVKISKTEMIGEITDYNVNNYTYSINLSNSVAGFNNKGSFKNKWFLSNEFELLDNGLNSPYTINIDSLLKII